MKQGTLFSFFAKKPDGVPSSSSKKSTITTATTTTTTTPSKAAASDNHNDDKSSASKPMTANSHQKAPSAADVDAANTVVVLATGTRLEVFWPDDDAWYPAVVVRGGRGDRTAVEYLDDGHTERIRLAEERWRLVETSNDNESSSKRRRIIQDDESDEEMEWDIAEDDDEESAFDNNDGEEDDADEVEDNWIVPDDYDEEEEMPKKKQKPARKPSLVVKRHSSSNTTASTPAAKPRPASTSTTGSSTTPSSSSSSLTTPPASRPTPSYVTPPSVESSAALTGASAATAASSNPHVAATPLPFVDKAVNVAGSHVHNHLPFLRDPVDAAGRPHHASTTTCDPRTLRVVTGDWTRVTGRPMTDAVRQWWDLKAQYFDTVLLFKTGKFYEMFHMDGDVGVRVCGASCPVVETNEWGETIRLCGHDGFRPTHPLLSSVFLYVCHLCSVEPHTTGLKYMKGAVAHAGFPEVAYGENADKLVRAGYKVARVEQTETPDQLDERKKRHRKMRRGGPAPKVVNREVCSILSLGTRTFCYLDERSALEQEEATSESQTGPLLAIREVVHDTPMMQEVDNGGDEEENDDDGTPAAACEYGVTLVDAIRGSVTLGQFADDVLRSRMQTLLTTHTPCEVSVY